MIMNNNEIKEEQEDTQLLKNSGFAGFYYDHGQAYYADQEEPIQWRKMGRLERIIGFWCATLTFAYASYAFYMTGLILPFIVVGCCLHKCFEILYIESLNDEFNGRIRSDSDK